MLPGNIFFRGSLNGAGPHYKTQEKGDVFPEAGALLNSMTGCASIVHIREICIPFVSHPKT